MVRRLLGLVSFLAIASSVAFCQGNSVSHGVILRVLPVASMALSDSGTIALDVAVPTGTDGVATVDTDTSKRLWYTAVNPAGTPRKIQVRMDGSTPAGTLLTLEAIVLAAGEGTSVTGGITLAGDDQDLIVSIPSCATGRTSTSGASLRYSFCVADRSVLRLEDTTVATVTFTIVDQ